MTGPDQAPAVAIAQSENGDALDVFIQAGPSSTRDDPRAQFASMADGAYRALRSQGLLPSSIVDGWIRFASAPPWDWREALASAWQVSGPLPITALVQPPADPFCACSVALHAIRTSRNSGVWYAPSPGLSVATVLRAGARHVRLMSVTPRADLGKTGNFADLTYDMFAQVGHALTARGLSFADVVRTWLHVHDIKKNYALMNQARNRYFVEQGLSRLPASTCVEGMLAGADMPVAMDVYAVLGGQQVQVEAMSPGTMGEASSYGSLFARATQLREPGRRWLYVSGTASIDTQGNVVAVGDVQGQLDCMFGNVRALLAQAGMGFADVVTATVYLKRAADLPAFARAARAHGLAQTVPCAAAVADICRPEWLCEVELCAVRKDEPASKAA
jgi:enamine deaminase RidA (YjgF/YER057c/UK114 family)